MTTICLPVVSFFAFSPELVFSNVAGFAGNYAALAMGVTVGGGAGSKTMQNDKGVVMDLVSTNQGVDFTLGPQGVKIRLE